MSDARKPMIETGEISHRMVVGDNTPRELQLSLSTRWIQLPEVHGVDVNSALREASQARALQSAKMQNVVADVKMSVGEAYLGFDDYKEILNKTIGREIAVMNEQADLLGAFAVSNKANTYMEDMNDAENIMQQSYFAGEQDITDRYGNVIAEQGDPTGIGYAAAMEAYSNKRKNELLLGVGGDEKVLRSLEGKLNDYHQTSKHRAGQAQIAHTSYYVSAQLEMQANTAMQAVQRGERSEDVIAAAEPWLESIPQNIPHRQERINAFIAGIKLEELKNEAMKDPIAAMKMSMEPYYADIPASGRNWLKGLAIREQADRLTRDVSKAQAEYNAMMANKDSHVTHVVENIWSDVEYGTADLYEDMEAYQIPKKFGPMLEQEIVNRTRVLALQNKKAAIQDGFRIANGYYPIEKDSDSNELTSRVLSERNPRADASGNVTCGWTDSNGFPLQMNEDANGNKWVPGLFNAQRQFFKKEIRGPATAYIRNGLETIMRTKCDAEFVEAASVMNEAITEDTLNSGEISKKEKERMASVYSMMKSGLGREDIQKIINNEAATIPADLRKQYLLEINPTDRYIDERLAYGDKPIHNLKGALVYEDNSNVARWSIIDIQKITKEVKGLENYPKVQEVVRHAYTSVYLPARLEHPPAEAARLAEEYAIDVGRRMISAQHTDVGTPRRIGESPESKVGHDTGDGTTVGEKAESAIVHIHNSTPHPGSSPKIVLRTKEPGETVARATRKTEQGEEHFAWGLDHMYEDEYGLLFYPMDAKTGELGVPFYAADENGYAKRINVRNAMNSYYQSETLKNIGVAVRNVEGVYDEIDRQAASAMKYAYKVYDQQ